MIKRGWLVTKWIHKILKVVGITLLAFFFLLVVALIYVWQVSKINPPVPDDLSSLSWKRELIHDSVYVIKNNWFSESSSHLHEMYVEGKPFERGVANGKLSEELVQYQEEVFNEQINKLVPSSIYREFLKYFVGWFNRNLDEAVQPEYKMEIYGVSQSASPKYDDIAPRYQRILNYHAAHDIGHALQNMSLVACTSFATWGNESVDSSLIIGRNFDFYVGDEFAEHKIVSFVHPDQGIDFVMITFPGMIGVLSGMNVNGLTVTINAGKSDIPSSSATPVSLVAREVLQYASTIAEAKAIIEKRQMFVSESFLIGSARDGRAAIIEKSPEAMDIFYPQKEYAVCTNHFQSKILGETELNQTHMKASPSSYRYQRVEELLNYSDKNTIEKTASILRNQRGLNNQNIGLGNEKAINQLVAHHAIIFQPEKLRIWVSTTPWQLGKFVCYDLSQGISGLTPNHQLRRPEDDIAPDTFLHSPKLKDFIKFSRYRFPFNSRQDMNPDSMVRWNPDSYLSYMLAGDAAYGKYDFKAAEKYYEKGLLLEIAAEGEREHMKTRLKKCKDRIK